MISRPLKLSILFVDDEPHYLMPLQRMFKRDYQLYTAGSGQDALTVMRQRPIHIAVSDLQMPAMSGVDLLQNIKELSPYTVRLLVGDETDKPVAERAVKDGLVLRYVQKPWNNDDFRKAISAADEIAKIYWRNEQAARYASSLKRNRGLLIIAEDIELCELVFQLFGKSNMVYHAVELDEAAAILSKRDIALTLMDASHVGQQSVKALAALKKIKPELLFIVLAEQKDAGLIVTLNTQGIIFRCLTKPTKGGLLKLTINSALKYYEQHYADTLTAADAATPVPAAQSGAARKPGGFADRFKSLWRHS